jgi:hypothetical protein
MCLLVAIRVTVTMIVLIILLPNDKNQDLYAVK